MKRLHSDIKRFKFFLLLRNKKRESEWSSLVQLPTTKYVPSFIFLDLRFEIK